jgi:hypothetical protein
MNLKHDIFLNGVAKVLQGFLLHVVDYTNVSSGEVGVGSGDDVIQFEACYNELSLIIGTMHHNNKLMIKIKDHINDTQLEIKDQHNKIH